VPQESIYKQELTKVVTAYPSLGRTNTRKAIKPVTEMEALNIQNVRNQ